MSNDRLQSEKLQRDPRVQQARQLLVAAMRDHRESLIGPRAADGARTRGYAELIEEFSKLRGGALFYPYLGSGIGNGALVELLDGSVKLDMIGGIGVHWFGHSDPALLEASVEAAIQDTITQGNLQQNVESVTLCREFVRLAGESGAPLRHCFLSTSGATANENALKMLFQARHPANRMLAFSNCFSGRTLATSQLTDRAKNRVGLPDVMPVDYVPFYKASLKDESIQQTLARLEEHLERYPGQHAGMIMELIQGEGGYYTAPRTFFIDLCELLRKHHVPIWFDEIQTFARTTRPFTFQHYELDQYADVVTVGKMTQVCATLFRDELVPKPNLVSQTFTGSTASIFAALSVLQRLREGAYFGSKGRLMEIHARFAGHFESIQQRHPDRIAGPWGLGGMIALTVCGGSAEKSKAFLDKLFQAGVIAFPAGSQPTRIRMLPPVGAVTNEQIDVVCRIIEDVLCQIDLA